MVGDRRPSSSLQDKLLQEKQRREHVLDLRQELAREVTQKSRQVAGLSLIETTYYIANTYAYALICYYLTLNIFYLSGNLLVMEKILN